LANFSVTGTVEGAERFAMAAPHGPFVRYFHWWALRHWLAWPRAGLFGAAARVGGGGPAGGDARVHRGARRVPAALEPLRHAVLADLVGGGRVCGEVGGGAI